MSAPQIPDFTLAYYSGDRKTGRLHVVRWRGGEARVEPLPTAEPTGLPQELRPVLVGVAAEPEAGARVLLLDPKSKRLEAREAFPADAFPAHVYRDGPSGRAWYMNDGDKETGNDRLHCGDQGSSVTVVERPDSAQARWLATICVGRGHHQCHFTHPSAQAPQVPRLAYVSNLKDGTLSVLGNDPARPETDLRVVATIDLCEPEKEEGQHRIPNHAFPHGLAYSPATGKVYNLNNGYGTVAVVDPLSHRIEARYDFPGHSNLFPSPDGRFLFGRGADRKSDPEHVLARLSVMDPATGEVLDSLRLPDVYLSKYFFNAEGTRLYFTLGRSGNEAQQAHLKQGLLLAFDLAGLPRLAPPAELALGAVDSVEVLAEGGRTRALLAADVAGGALEVLDPEEHRVLARVPVTEGASHGRIWLLRG